MKAAREMKSGKLNTPVFLNDDLTTIRMRAFKLALELKKRRATSNAFVKAGSVVVVDRVLGEKFLKSFSECESFIKSNSSM